MKRTTVRQVAAIPVAVAAVAALVVGCSSDDDPTDDDSTSETSGASDSPTTPEEDATPETGDEALALIEESDEYTAGVIVEHHDRIEGLIAEMEAAINEDPANPWAVTAAEKDNLSFIIVSPDSTTPILEPRPCRGGGACSGDRWEVARLYDDDWVYFQASDAGGYDICLETGGLASDAEWSVYPWARSVDGVVTSGYALEPGCGHSDG